MNEITADQAKKSAIKAGGSLIEKVNSEIERASKLGRFRVVVLADKNIFEYELAEILDSLKERGFWAVAIPGINDTHIKIDWSGE